MAKVSRHTQPAELGRCSKHSRRTIRPAQALKKQLQTIRPVQASQQNNSQPMKLAGLLPCSAGGGGSAVVLATQKVGSDLPNYLPPTYRLCLSLSIPTPLICKTQFCPNLFFCFYFCFYFPTIIRPLTPFTVSVRLTYRLLAYSQPLRSLFGGE